MNESGLFFMCGSCSRKVKRDDLAKGEYYCSHFDSVFPGGFVTERTDASACIKEGWYQKIT